MFTRLARLIVFFAAVQIVGGHWLVLQSVAWDEMIASHARGETLMVALEKTFDGKHPCSMCKMVKSGREQEQKQPLAKMIVKLDAVLADTMQLPAPHGADWKYPVLVPMAAERSLAPPTPPPQAV